MSLWIIDPESQFSDLIPPLPIGERLLAPVISDRDLLAALPRMGEGLANAFNAAAGAQKPGRPWRELADALRAGNLRKARAICDKRQANRQLYLVGLTQKGVDGVAREAIEPCLARLASIGRDADIRSAARTAANARVEERAALAVVQAWRALGLGTRGPLVWGTALGERLQAIATQKLAKAMRDEAEAHWAAKQPLGGGRIEGWRLAPLARAAEEPWRTLWTLRELGKCALAEHGTQNNWFPFSEVDDIAQWGAIEHPEAAVKRASDAALAATESMILAMEAEVAMRANSRAPALAAGPSGESQEAPRSGPRGGRRL